MSDHYCECSACSEYAERVKELEDALRECCNVIETIMESGRLKWSAEGRHDARATAARGRAALASGNPPKAAPSGPDAVRKEGLRAAAQGSITEPDWRELLARLLLWANMEIEAARACGIWKPHGYIRDWACGDCVANTPARLGYVVDGFRCGYHAAKSALEQPRRAPASPNLSPVKVRD